MSALRGSISGHASIRHQWSQVAICAYCSGTEYFPLLLRNSRHLVLLSLYLCDLLIIHTSVQFEWTRSVTLPNPPPLPGCGSESSLSNSLYNKYVVYF